MNAQTPINLDMAPPEILKREVDLGSLFERPVQLELEKDTSGADLAGCLSRLLDSLLEAVEGRGSYAVPRTLSSELASRSADENPEAFPHEDSYLLPIAPISASRRDFQVRQDPGIQEDDFF